MSSREIRHTLRYPRERSCTSPFILSLLDLRFMRAMADEDASTFLKIAGGAIWKTDNNVSYVGLVAVLYMSQQISYKTVAS
jgi:hypothetical protein